MYETKFERVLRAADIKVTAAKTQAEVIAALEQVSQLTLLSELFANIKTILGLARQVIFGFVFFGIFTAVVIGGNVYFKEQEGSGLIIAAIITVLAAVLRGLNSLFFKRPAKPTVHIRNLTHKAAEKHARLALGMQDIENAENYGQFESEFSTFYQGIPATRKFNILSNGRYNGSEHRFDFTYFDFVSEVRSDNRTHRQNIYGLVCAFPYAQGLQIQQPFIKKMFGSNGANLTHKIAMESQRWRSPSISFNESFATYVSNADAAAKFFKPVILTAIEDHNNSYQGLELEFSEHGDLCISYRDNDALTWLLPCSLSDLPLLIQNMQDGEFSKSKFMYLLDFVHVLMKYSDNNFDAMPQGAERNATPWGQ